MTGKEIFKIWAPVGAKWVDWVRPVPFIYLNEKINTNEYFHFTIPTINYINEVTSDTAVIIDLPSYESVTEAIALAKIGFRPIPIYNGTDEQNGSRANVDNHALEVALLWGALELKQIDLNKETSPVFLLDSNRLHRFKMDVSIFDNSWDIYPQDIPSSTYFKANGITKIIVRGETIQRDLKKILYKFQQEGIKIYFTNGYEEPIEIKLKKSFLKEV